MAFAPLRKKYVWSGEKKVVILRRDNAVATIERSLHWWLKRESGENPEQIPLLYFPVLSLAANSVTAGPCAGGKAKGKRWG